MDFLKNYFVVLLALILVFVLNVSFTLGDNKLMANYDFDSYKILKVREGLLVLECNVTDLSSNSDYFIKWSKEGQELKSNRFEDGRQIDVSPTGKVTIKRPNMDDAGNYTCSLHAGTKSEPLSLIGVNVVAKPYVRINPSQMVFIEGEELKIECNIIGRPTPSIMWKFGNTSYDKSAGRVKITINDDKNIIKSYFEIEKAEMSDRGVYECIAQNIANSNPSEPSVSKATCTVRIKDKYAALWPFIGIVVEVVVLCAVIFIYEKKRNKAELEESDTDQSPEQLEKRKLAKKRPDKIFVPLDESESASHIIPPEVQRSVIYDETTVETTRSRTKLGEKASHKKLVNKSEERNEEDKMQ